MRSRRRGFRVLFGLAGMLLLDGCRTWDDRSEWHGHGHHYRHHHHQRGQPHPPPAPLVVPKIQPPVPLPSLPAQPTYRAPVPNHQWHRNHQSGESSRRPGHGHGTGDGGRKHEHKWQDRQRGEDYRRRR